MGVKAKEIPRFVILDKILHPWDTHYQFFNLYSQTLPLSVGISENPESANGPNIQVWYSCKSTFHLADMSTSPYGFPKNH